MDVVADLEWVLRVVGSGIPAGLAVFEAQEDGLRLVAANDAYLSLFPTPAPRVGDVLAAVLPGADPQIDGIVASVVNGDSFCAESWVIPAPPGTYSTGVAYCDWSLRSVSVFGTTALVLLLTDATRRTEQKLCLAEELVRLRDALSLT
jgi:hypothetical protein